MCFSKTDLIYYFGLKSNIYADFKQRMQTFLDQLKNNNHNMSYLEAWKRKFESRNIEIRKSPDLWINQIFFLLIANLVLQLYLNNLKVKYPNSGGQLGQITEDFKFENNSDLFLMDWILDAGGNEIISRLKVQIISLIKESGIWEIQGDFFRELYEELITKTSRLERGEYYTPDWLADLIVGEVWRIWNQSVLGKAGKKNPKILDPACGSGTFIFMFVNLYYERVSKKPPRNNHLEVHGFDINPIAVYVARINYILAIPPLILFDILNTRPRFYLDIITKDSLDIDSKILRENGQSFENSFDIIIGNPPWLVLRSINNLGYQDRLKKEFIKFNLVRSTDVHLFTQLDVATLFFAKSFNFYLKEGGKIAFVMPKSVLTGAKQHEKFRKFNLPQMGLDRIWDLQEVTPLFYMPACVLFATKGKKVQYPVKMIKWNGDIPKNGIKLGTYGQFIETKETEYIPPKFQLNKSWYYNKFKVGLSIFPRNFYFVHIGAIKDSYVEIKTEPEVNSLSKPRWKDIFLKGKISTEYLFVTLLSWEMFSFGYNRLRYVALPISSKRGNRSSYVPITLEDLKQKDKNSYEWFAQADETWNRLSTERSKVRFPTLLARLNYNNLISYQSPDRRYLVAFSGTGTNLTSCVIDKRRLKSVPAKNPLRFIADVKTWFLETNESSEAHYLSAVFNSNVLNKLIKPLQPQGLGGGRAIHRRALAFPIPQFNPSKPIHCELAKLSKIAHDRLIGTTFRKSGTMRKKARRKILDILPNLDQQVTNLLAPP
ncbi:MAG: class I SAM-dependent DNA methyltransferase [Candidatus Heimdallarchaeota archaeon]